MLQAYLQELDWEHSFFDIQEYAAFTRGESSMKLTNDDFGIYETIANEDCTAHVTFFEKNYEYELQIRCSTEEDTIYLQKKILENQEKAEKYDTGVKSLERRILAIGELREENRQLKEIESNINEKIRDLNRDMVIMKKMHPNIESTLHNMLHSWKAKLNRIEEYKRLLTTVPQKGNQS